jgi:hypothetical protein
MGIFKSYLTLMIGRSLRKVDKVVHSLVISLGILNHHFHIMVR